MDAITLDNILAELRPILVGRRLGRLRIVAPLALAVEVAGDRSRRLWLDAGPGTAGVYILDRGVLSELEGLAGADTSSRTRNALLLFRKHLEGARVSGLDRVLGERVLVLQAGPSSVALRFAGRNAALTLAVGEAAVATIGEGPAAWPLPPPSPEREWNAIDPQQLASAVSSALSEGRPAVRAVLDICPSLDPALARALEATPASVSLLQRRLAEPRPTLLAPGPLESCRDADLAPVDAVNLVPIALEISGRVNLRFPSWLEAAALFLRARYRGARFGGLRRAALEAAQRETRRLSRLEGRLASDLAGLPSPSLLRLHAEALLAAPVSIAAGAPEVEVANPYDASSRLRIKVDPQLSLPANADRLFGKARRVERSRPQVEERLAQTRTRLAEAKSEEDRLLQARSLADLLPGPRPREGSAAAPEELTRTPRPPQAVRHYLTSRGLSLLVGRGARENHRLTFGLARPEDLWLHAQEAPGAHVILRDPEGRAGPEDLREAAEVAAFFSGVGKHAQADVHVTRRKHVRPARGKAGRVHVSHSDTLRVTPRDPEGRLRRRR